MSIERYYSYAQHLASWGYVVVLPTFSNSFPTPEHYECAHSMVDAARWIAGKDTVIGDIFYEKLDRCNWGLVGHSMGGGVAHLAADTFGLTDTLKVTVSMASPQTTPPTHSQHLIAPKLIMAGSIDYLAPWNDVRAAYWDSAPAPGTFAVIDGANHGYFMDYSYTWENGGTATISRDEQLRIARRHMTAYFQRYMKNDTSVWNFHYCYGDSIYNHPTMDTVEVRYNTFILENRTGECTVRSDLKVFPNPVKGSCRIDGIHCCADIFNAIGQRIAKVVVPGYWYPKNNLKSGVYFIRPENGAPHTVVLVRD
jgi:dienelactone hydrolase